jgi:hypothetical protein
MSLENAKANLEEFGKELKIGPLEFDPNFTCILSIDEKFSLHLTFVGLMDMLCLYGPVLDGLPEDKKLLLKLYEYFLEGSMLGGQVAGGGIGVAKKEGLVLLHRFLDMGPGADKFVLKNFAPIFVETLEAWRKIAEEIVAGREPTKPDFLSPQGGSPQNSSSLPSSSSPGSGPRPHERYTKV